MRKVNSGDGVRRYVPTAGNCPVSAVDKAGGCVIQTCRLCLRQLCRRAEDGNKTGTHTGVIAHAINLNGVRGGIRVDFERYCLADIDTYVCGKPLDRRITCPSY